MRLGEYQRKNISNDMEPASRSLQISLHLASYYPGPIVFPSAAPAFQVTMASLSFALTCQSGQSGPDVKASGLGMVGLSMAYSQDGNATSRVHLL